MIEQAPKLADQYKAELEALEERLADVLIDFTARTGFVVEGVQPFYHSYRSTEEEPYYAIVVKIKQ